MQFPKFMHMDRTIAQDQEDLNTKILSYISIFLVQKSWESIPTYMGWWKVLQMGSEQTGV